MPKEKGYAHVALLTILVLGVLGLVVSSNINTTQKFSTPSPQVLGEDETAQKAAEQAKESAQKAAEQAKESSQKAAEQQKENQQTSTQSEGNKQETEIQNSNGQKIKTKVEDNGATKIEVEQGNLKLKYETEKGQTKLEVENELENEGVQISTESGKLTITKNRTTASTDFPLSVNTTTHQLIVTTPVGQKAITILPDQATSSALLDKLNGTIKLEIRDNEMVYKIKGEKRFRIFGIIPVSTPTTAYVSAQSGSLVAQEQSLLTNLIKLISSQ